MLGDYWAPAGRRLEEPEYSGRHLGAGPKLPGYTGCQFGVAVPGGRGSGARSSVGASWARLQASAVYWVPAGRRLQEPEDCGRQLGAAQGSGVYWGPVWRGLKLPEYTGCQFGVAVLNGRGSGAHSSVGANWARLQALAVYWAPAGRRLEDPVYAGCQFGAALGSKVYWVALLWSNRLF